MLAIETCLTHLAKEVNRSVGWPCSPFVDESRFGLDHRGRKTYVSKVEIDEERLEAARRDRDRLRLERDRLLREHDALNAAMLEKTRALGAEAAATAQLEAQLAALKAEERTRRLPASRRVAKPARKKRRNRPK